jgi:hypothetical protein
MLTEYLHNADIIKYVYGVTSGVYINLIPIHTFINS